VFARTLSLDLIHGQPESRRRIETQVLHFDGRDWHAYSYRWNEAQTDADLVDGEGDATTLTLLDERASGGRRNLPWRFHARGECLKCHNDDAARVLGFIPGNLDIETLHTAGIVSTDHLPIAAATRLVDPADERAPIDQRARSWLQANCAHCHRFQGGGSGAFRVNIEVAADQTLLETKPLQGTFGLADARVVAPGAPDQSTLIYRVAKSGPGRMPQLGSSTPDPNGLRVVWDWIASRPFAPPAEPSVDTPGRALHVAQAIDRGALIPTERERLVAAGLAHDDPLVRALFERHLPDDQRVATLGHVVDPNTVLALRGRPETGHAVATRAACLTCHRIGDEGRDFGPDLSAIGLRLSREQLLESLLEPSKTLPAAFTARSFELADGTLHTGFLLEPAGDSLRLRVASGDVVTFAKRDVRHESALPASLMPAGLLAELTAQEAADLVAYLQRLTGASTSPRE
jgi:putative heme-binding domain-containing protein